MKKLLLFSALCLLILRDAKAQSYGGYAHLDGNSQVVATELTANTYGLLNTVSGVDLKATGQTTLYTVPSGKSAIITEIVGVISSANTVAVPPAARIGLASAYTEWMPITTFTGINATNQFFNLSSSGALLIHTLFTTGQVVKIDVTTGATATTLTGTFYVFGFLI